MNNIARLKKISKKFPNLPGVYFFRNGNGKPIYIGRAGSLKKRIASYFRTKDLRIQEMVFSAHSVDFEKTETLLEAVILEANLIKKYWPKYNVVDKDDTSFAYLAILPGLYPKPVIVRGREMEKYLHSKIKIFGPYQSFRLLKTALELARKIFPYSICAPNSGKACFYYQIGLCPGACIGAISPEKYKKNIKNLILFFSGEKKKLIKELKRNNPAAIKALQHVQDVTLLAGSDTVRVSGEGVNGRIEGYDISHLSGKEPVGAMVVFESGAKNSSQYRLFKIRGAKTQTRFRQGSDGQGKKEVINFNDIDMLKEVLERRLEHKEWLMPQIIFVDGGLNQVRTAKEVLKKRNMIIPIVGLAKTGGHSASDYLGDKLIIANVKKSGREMVVASKKLFQEVRNEAHRFAISYSRFRRNKN
ncbi:MAG: GIY-YIG nuclease family protein [Candidatus Pacebacteria bacterium]|nr:GIY-YIG nuclease family protein [Candidatus Paceibacterota bacterium]